MLANMDNAEEETSTFAEDVLTNTHVSKAADLVIDCGGVELPSEELSKRSPLRQAESSMSLATDSDAQMQEIDQIVGGGAGSEQEVDLATSTAGLVKADLKQPTIQDLEKENKTLRGENESLHDDLNNMKARLVDLERYVQYLVAAEEKRDKTKFKRALEDYMLQQRYNRLGIRVDWTSINQEMCIHYVNFVGECLQDRAIAISLADFPISVSQIIVSYLVQDYNWSDIESRDPMVIYNGHQKRLLAIRIESTDRYMFSAGQDYMLKMWEIETGECKRTFCGHGKNINTIEFSSDERYVLTASSDNTAKMWEIETGECVHTYVGHTDTLWGIHIYQNDERLVTVSTDNTHRIWDIQTEKELLQWSDPDGSVYNMDITSDERFIYTGGHNGVCKKWELKLGTLVKRYEKHTNYVQVVFATRDASKLISGSKDFTTVVWDTETGKRIHTLRDHNGCIRDLKLSKDDRYLFTVGDDSMWMVFNMDTGERLLKRRIHQDDATACDLNSNDTRFFTGSESKDCKMWYLKDLTHAFKEE